MALTRVGSKGLAPGAVDPNDIAANAIIEAKIANDAVTEIKIVDGAVTPNKISGEVPVTKGGTGAASLTANAILLGNGTSAVATVSAGDTGNVLTSDGTAWISKAISAGGNLVAQIYTANTTWTKPDNLKAVRVTVVGGGGGVGLAVSSGVTATGGTGGTSSFGAFASATGGAGGSDVLSGCPNASNQQFGLGGLGSGGNVNLSGDVGMSRGFINGASLGTLIGGKSFLSGRSLGPPRPASSVGFGAGAARSPAPAGPISAPGGGGGTSIVYLSAPDIPGPVTVTIGRGGTRTVSPAPSAPPYFPSTEAFGGNGVVIVEEFY